MYYRHEQIKKVKDAVNHQLLFDLKRKVSRIINGFDTVKKNVTDWPDIHNYLKSRFPHIDISAIPIYITTPAAMRSIDLDCGGCYIDILKVILVRNKIVTMSPSSDGKFDKLMSKLSKSEVNVEDIVVHEMVHAVSHRIRGTPNAKYEWFEGGIGIKFRHAEEEFVYTNCLPYYKDKGMTDEQVVNSIILPFMVNDVMTDRDFVNKMWFNLGVTMPQNVSYKELKSKSKRLSNKHADVIVPVILEEARRRSSEMIQLFHKYGSISNKGEDNTHLDMDFDF